MEILLFRDTFTAKSTIGSLTDLNGDPLYEVTQEAIYILEDADRGLESTMTLSEIASKKVYGQTAIPTGRYEIIMSYSNRFKRPLPLLLDVPGFAGIRIHNGSFPEHTEGCLLPGLVRGMDQVTQSRDFFKEKLLPWIDETLKKEKLFIIIKRLVGAYQLFTLTPPPVPSGGEGGE